MNISLIVAHPNKNSFNHAIALAACVTLREHGHTVFFHDLYEEGFDPLMPSTELAQDAPLPPELKRYCDELTSSDGIIVVHPNWWGQPPAILKGWVDRVVRPGVAYRFEAGDGGEGVPVGLLKAKAAIVFNTSNTPTEREMEVFGDPLELLWKKCIWEFCGIKKVHRETFSVVITSTPEQRAEWLKQAKQTVSASFP